MGESKRDLHHKFFVHSILNVVAQLRALTNQYPAGSRISIRCLVPAVVDHSGHIPNLLQDLVLQMYGGLQLASEIDRAVTYFREQGNWPPHLSHLPLHNPKVSRPNVPDAPHAAGIPHVNGAPVPVLGPAVRDPGPAACSNTSVGHNPAGNPEQLRVHTRESSTNLQPNSNVALFPTHLHQHACDRRMSVACGTRRRCRICNTRIPHRTHYFHCSQNCRFTVCTACFRPSTQRANTCNDNARQRATSEPPQLQTAGDAVASVNPGLYGRAVEHISQDILICRSMHSLIK